MPLADHLRAERRRHFVGRKDECQLFETALDDDALSFHVLHVHGPGGVGKTALLREFAGLCGEQDTPVHYLDARSVEPSAEAILEALRAETGAAWPDEAPHEGRFVLMIDTIETLAPLERWLRETFLPRLPARVLLVLSGRDELPAAWRADAGLQALVRTLPLRNLSPEASRCYLERRGVPEGRRETVVDFAHGHPLALSLAADAFDQRSHEGEVAPVESPNLIGALLKRFVQEVPSPQHRTAVQACALVRAVTEPLLNDLLDGSVGDDGGGGDETRALFDWLRGLSFIESGRDGLFPHDIAREVLAADLRWRDPDKYDALRRRARRYYAEQLREGRQPASVLTDYVFLFRDNPVVRPYFQRLQSQWEGHAPLVRDRVRADDWSHLQRMAARHEGERAAQLLDHWRARQPDRARVFRDGGETPAGFIFPLALHETTEPDREQDPCVRSAWNYLEAKAPLREGERAILFRFWMDRDEHQALSPVQSLISAYRVRHFLMTPDLAFTFSPCAQPEMWTLIFAYGDLQRLPEADCDVGDQSYAFFGHDWRTVPPAAWLDLLAEREVRTEEPDSVPRPAGTSVLVLSEPDFADAVKGALDRYARPDALRDNPLLRSRLVVTDTGLDADAEERIRRLRMFIRAAASALQADARTEKFYRALHATYLDPAPTQEKASERLEVPFSTYRRHLRRGRKHITEALWQQETGSTLDRS